MMTNLEKSLSVLPRVDKVALVALRKSIKYTQEQIEELSKSIVKITQEEYARELQGDPEFRSLLYMASWSAIRFNASCRNYISD